jgi:hypothetical protein
MEGGQRDGRTDMTKPIVAFRNFANAPNYIKMDRKRLGYECVVLIIWLGIVGPAMGSIEQGEETSAPLK